MLAIKNILVATDFSEPSGVALAYGRDLARNYHARLHLLHVVEDVMARYSSEVGVLLPSIQEDLEKAARRELEARITEDDRKQLEAAAVIETGANIADAICRYAKANSIDLIVTGTHGRGAVKHFLMGSVAERVVRTAPCPGADGARARARLPRPRRPDRGRRGLVESRCAFAATRTRTSSADTPSGITARGLTSSSWISGQMPTSAEMRSTVS